MLGLGFSLFLQKYGSEFGLVLFGISNRVIERNGSVIFRFRILMKDEFVLNYAKKDSL